MGESPADSTAYVMVESYPEAGSNHRSALEKFILFWGEMASYWGINRTMAQLHALLYASEDPLDTDQIMEALKISRGNANMNLRSLITWDLVRKEHQPGSRKDYFSAEKDVWRITAQIIKERMRREIRPVLDNLESCKEIVAQGKTTLDPGEQAFVDRIDNLREFMHVFEGVTDALLPLLDEENAPLIRQLVEFAKTMQEADDGDG